MQQPARPKMSADQWEALASSWARHGIPMGRMKTARRCVEAGIRLLILKEITTRGDFLDRVNALGVNASAAARWMAVARRFRGAPDAFFEAIGTASKLVELLPLEDADALAHGKSLHGLTLDRVAEMTVKELRAAVRAVVEKKRSERGLLEDRSAAIARLARFDTAQSMASNAPTTAHLPKRAAPRARLTVEEERMLRRYRKCNADGRAALLQVAGLLEQKPTP